MQKMKQWKQQIKVNWNQLRWNNLGLGKSAVMMLRGWEHIKGNHVLFTKHEKKLLQHILWAKSDLDQIGWLCHWSVELCSIKSKIINDYVLIWKTLVRCIAKLGELQLSDIQFTNWLDTVYYQFITRLNISVLMFNFHVLEQGPQKNEFDSV